MKIAVFEPFYAGSHRQWLDGMIRFSTHEIHAFTLPGRHWKWRMHGGALTLANKFLESDFDPDLIMCTDMVDVGLLLSLIRRRARDIPVVLYMHENQLTYPWSDSDPDVAMQRDNHYAFLNYSSACTADAVCFNSPYHMESFMGALMSFLKQFPDHQNLQTIEQIQKKSSVLPLGLDLRRFDAFKSHNEENRLPTLLWNHRWEYDKSPQDFFELIEKLDEQGLEFELVVCGEQALKVPEVFTYAKQQFKHRIKHFGFVENAADYAQLLAGSDIVPVTSVQDFFGISIVEAMYSGVKPILPRRLTYEWLAGYTTGSVLYDTKDELFEATSKAIENRSLVFESDRLLDFDWRNIISRYDEYFNEI